MNVEDRSDLGANAHSPVRIYRQIEEDSWDQDAGIDESGNGSMNADLANAPEFGSRINVGLNGIVFAPVVLLTIFDNLVVHSIQLESVPPSDQRGRATI